MAATTPFKISPPCFVLHANMYLRVFLAKLITEELISLVIKTHPSIPDSVASLKVKPLSLNISLA